MNAQHLYYSWSLKQMLLYLIMAENWEKNIRHTERQVLGSFYLMSTMLPVPGIQKPNPEISSTTSVGHLSK